MKLSLMLEFFNTVDENWKSELANELLKPWEHDEGSLRVYRASANFACFFTNNKQPFFLRFNHEDERNIQLLENEIKLHQYLIEKDIKVALPILSLNNRYIETKQTNLGVFYAVVFEGIQGESFELEELSIEKFYSSGKILGKLHQVFKLLPNDYIERPNWKDQLNFVLETISSDDQKALKEIEVLKKECALLPQDKNHYGLIHYDFGSDNLIFCENDIVSIDYDDCCYHWYLGDIVYALRDLNDDNDRIIDQNKFDQFIKGYETETNLDKEMLNHINLMHRLHHIYQYGRLIRAVDIKEDDVYPEWMNGLIQKLSKTIKKLHSGFLNRMRLKNTHQF